MFEIFYLGGMFLYLTYNVFGFMATTDVELYRGDLAERQKYARRILLSPIWPVIFLTALGGAVIVVFDAAFKDIPDGK